MAAEVDIAREVAGSLIVGALAISMLVGSELLKRFTPLPRETTRKFAHTGSGCALLSIPFVIDSHWTVLALSISFCLLMVVTHLTGLLSSVHGVGRGVGGVLWYPFTGWLVYYVVYEQFHEGFVLYAVPILVLAAADAFGALVGTSYGRHRYEVMEGHFRSIEGSTAFFVVAFFCIHVPLLLGNVTGRAETLLVSIIIALLAALLETISVYGLDNLIVPFGVLFVLERIDHLPVGDLLLRLVLLSACAAIVTAINWRKQGTAGGLVSLLLMLYGTWTLAGLTWLGPLAGMLVAFVLYERLSPVELTHTKSRYEMGTAVAALTVPALLVIGNELVRGAEAQYALFVAFLAALAADAAVIFYMLPQNRTFRFKRLRRAVTTQGAWQYGVTPGKVAFALVGAALPVVFGTAVPTVLGRSDAAHNADLGLALVLGSLGLSIFLLAASNPRAHYACPACGSVTLRGLYCCQDERLGDGSQEGWRSLTFRKAFLLANSTAALAVIAALSLD